MTKIIDNIILIM